MFVPLAVSHSCDVGLVLFPDHCCCYWFLCMPCVNCFGCTIGLQETDLEAQHIYRRAVDQMLLAENRLVHSPQGELCVVLNEAFSIVLRYHLLKEGAAFTRI